MYKARVEVEIDSGHFLKLTYPSKCVQQHGHRWRIVVYLASNKLNENGMIIDFTAIKDCVKEYDHVNLNKKDSFKEVNPTAENFAGILAREITDKLELEMNKPVVYQIDVYETEKNMVTWERD